MGVVWDVGALLVVTFNGRWVESAFSKGDSEASEKCKPTESDPDNFLSDVSTFVSTVPKPLVNPEDVIKLTDTELRGYRLKAAALLQHDYVY